MSSPPPPPERQASKAADYYTEEIRVVRGLEHIRRNPAMYLGDTRSPGLHLIPLLLLEFALDQFLAGRGQLVSLDLLADGTCRVTFDSFGPWATAPSLAALCLNLSHKIEVAAPAVPLCYSYLPNSVVLGITAALSNEFELAIVHDGQRRSQQFCQGQPRGTEQSVRCSEPPGTTITFRPDATIFTEGARLDGQRLAPRLQQLSYLLPGLTLQLTEHRPHPLPLRTATFRSNHGLPEFLCTLAHAEDWVHGEVFYVEAEESEQRCQVALRWTRQPHEDVRLFVNLALAPQGGTPVEGLRRALTPLIKKYGRIYGVLNEEPLAGKHCRAGLVAVLSVLSREPQWAGAVKHRIINPELCPLVERAVQRLLPLYLEANPTDATAIARRALAAYHQRPAAKKRSK